MPKVFATIYDEAITEHCECFSCDGSCHCECDGSSDDPCNWG